MTECFSQLQIAQDLGYISEADIDGLRPTFNKVAALLSILRKSYERKMDENFKPLNF